MKILLISFLQNRICNVMLSRENIKRKWNSKNFITISMTSNHYFFIKTGAERLLCCVQYGRGLHCIFRSCSTSIAFYNNASLVYGNLRLQTNPRFVNSPRNRHLKLLIENQYRYSLYVPCTGSQLIDFLKSLGTLSNVREVMRGVSSDVQEFLQWCGLFIPTVRVI